MFAWWGRTVYRYRYIVIGVMVALCLGGGVFGASLGQHVTQSGFYNEGSESVRASLLSDEVYGRDRTSHVVAILTPPDAISQCMMAVPMWLLFEIGVLFGGLVRKRSAEREAAEHPDDQPPAAQP